MEKIDPAVFHKLYGIKKTRIAYHRRDFLDYLLMIFLSAIAVSFSYGFDHIMSIVGLGLCAFTLAAFIARHGVEFSVPVILRRPQDVLYMFVYKLQNLRPMYFITLGLLLLENVLIAATPNLPHHNVIVHWKWIMVYNAWFYRDHWVGHNSELEFIYLHGPHHDAIPSGMIAVSGNGFLEGITRYTLGAPTAFYNPVVSFMINMAEVAVDIKRHQYIPGVFPRLSKSFLEGFQHSIHHYGLLEPYSVGLKTDNKMNTIWLDERLTGFKWDNQIQRKILSLYDKYQK